MKRFLVQMVIGIILLAAGNSSRLGRPKQLLKFQGKTLLRRAAETATAIANVRTVAVLGVNSAAFSPEIADLNLEIVVNSDWQIGMSATIKCGLNKLLELTPDLSAVVVLLCDQPFVTGATIQNLIDEFRRTKKPIVVCEYEKNVGVPALFAAEKFADLLNLQGETGARFLIKNELAANITKIAAPEAAFDIDTLADYEKLLQTIG